MKLLSHHSIKRIGSVKRPGLEFFISIKRTFSIQNFGDITAYHTVSIKRPSLNFITFFLKI